MMKLLTLLFLFIFFNLYSSEYYVSKDGSDFNRGSKDFPFKTIQFALNKLKAGDICYVRKGTYRESITFKNSGLESKIIHLKNYKNEKVIIAPSIIKKKWEKYSENIYRIPFQQRPLQIFINGKSIMQATYPNITEGSLSTSSWRDIESFSNKTIKMKGTEKFNSLEGVNFLGICGRGLVALNGEIISAKKNTLQIKNNAFYWGEKYLNSYLGKGKGFLVGSIEFLDYDGEWFWDKGYLYMYSNSGEVIKKKIEVRINKDLVTLKNCNYINIEGIDVFGGAINAENCNHCIINKISNTYTVPYSTFDSGFDRFSSDTSKDYYNIKNWHGVGTRISGSYNKITNCTIKKSWGDGLTVWGHHNTVENCAISDCNWLGTDCAVLNISGYKNNVIHNTLKKAGRSILLHRKLKNSKIKYNIISNGGILCDDLGLTYCYQTDGDMTEISYNWLYSNNALIYGSGIYIDNGCSNFYIHHNVIWNSFIGISINSPSKNITVSNNTIFDIKYNMSSFNPVKNKKPFENVRVYNNLTSSSLIGHMFKPFYGSYISNNFINSKLFEELVNPTENNFSLKKDSKYIDLGIKDTLNKTYSGESPDIGAYENGAEIWIPGYTVDKSKLEKSIIKFIIPLIIFLIIIIVIIKHPLFMMMDLSTNKKITLFLIRIAFSVSSFFIYTFYFSNRYNADVFKHFDDAKFIYSDVFKESPSLYLKWCLGYDSKSSEIIETLNQTKYWYRQPNNLFDYNQILIRFHGWVNLISFGNYFTHLILFSFIGFIGSTLFFLCLKPFFNKKIKSLIIGAFLIPSTLFFSSGTAKDTLIFFSLSLFIYLILKEIKYNLKKLIIRIFLIFISLIFLFSLKPFIIITLIPTIIFFLFIRKKINIFLLFSIVHVIYYIIIFNIPLINLSNRLNYIQNDLFLVAEEMNASSKMLIPIISNNISLVKNIPSALYSNFISPIQHFNEGILYFVSAAENMFFITLILLAIFYKKKNNLIQKKIILIILSFTIGIILFIGWTIPILGEVVRYRSLVWSYLFSIILLIIDWDKLKHHIKVVFFKKIT